MTNSRFGGTTLPNILLQRKVLGDRIPISVLMNRLTPWLRERRCNSILVRHSRMLVSGTLSRRIPLDQKTLEPNSVPCRSRRLHGHRRMGKGKGKGKSKGKGKDSSGEKGKGKGKQPLGKGKATICWNCGKRGHRQADCSSAQSCASAFSSCCYCCTLASVRCTNIHCSTTVTVHDHDQGNHIPKDHATSVAASQTLAD